MVIVRKLPDLIGTISWDYDERPIQPLKEDVIRKAKGLNSEGLVYFFYSLKDDGKKVSYQYIMYNADTKKRVASAEGSWAKENW